MPIELKDIISPGIAALGVAVAYLKLRSNSEREKGQLSERIKNLSEDVKPHSVHIHAF